MNKWLFLLLLPSLAFAKWPASANMRKDPIYVEVESQKVVIYPEKMEIPATSLDILTFNLEMQQARKAVVGLLGG